MSVPAPGVMCSLQPSILAGNDTKRASSSSSAGCIWQRGLQRWEVDFLTWKRATVSRKWEMENLNLVKVGNKPVSTFLWIFFLWPNLSSLYLPQSLYRICVLCPCKATFRLADPRTPPQRDLPCPLSLSPGSPASGSPAIILVWQLSILLRFWFHHLCSVSYI
jgi:hypothetical protein